MRLEKSRQLLKLALMMQASVEGIGIQDIQSEFEVVRRTAERMRDALLMLFPNIEEIFLDGKTKRWRLPLGSISGLMQISAENLAEMKTAINLLRKEHLARTPLSPFSTHRRAIRRQDNCTVQGGRLEGDVLVRHAMGRPCRDS